MKQSLLTVFTVFLSILTSAQEPLTAEDMNITIGTEFQLNAAGFVEPGEAGINQTWDFSFVFAQDNSFGLTVDPAEHPQAASFPTANLCTETLSGYNFNEINADAYIDLGSVQGSGLELIFENPAVLFEFPLSLNSSFTDDFVLPYSVMTVTGVLEGNIEGLVDGYGTLILPWGTITEVYRVNTTVNQTENYTFNGEENTVITTGNRYFWVAPGYPGAIAVISDLEQYNVQQDITTPFQNFIYYSNFEFLGVNNQEIVEHLQVYPNPAVDQLSISFEKRSAELLNIEVLDIRGRVLLSQTGLAAGMGTFNHQINLGNLNPGYYLLRLIDASGVQAQKIAIAR